MLSIRMMFYSTTLYFLLPLVLSHTLQKDSCCTRKKEGLRQRPISSIRGCICKEATDSYSICYNANNDQNSCKKYPEEMMINTTELILRSTSITDLMPGDFLNLKHIEALKLETNLKLKLIHELVFREMKDLKILHIISSPLLNNFLANTFQGLVNLEELKIVNCGFLKLQDLTMALELSILPNLQKLSINGHNFSQIGAQDFEAMGEKSGATSQLQELDLSSCGILNMEKEVFNPLKKLSYLHLGNNSLSTQNLVDLLKTAVRSKIPLKSLDLHSFGISSSLPQELTEVLEELGIETMDLTNNHFGILELNSINYTLPKLKNLNLSNVQVNFLDSSFFKRTPNLETLILNRHNLSYFTMPRNLPNLKYLDLSQFSKKGNWEFFHLETQTDATKVEYLDLHLTRLAYLVKDSFKFMPELKELDLSKCTIAKISTGAFGQLSKLKYLNLEDNKFFIIYIKYPSEPFLGLENLETLLVGGNDISYITSGEHNLFKYLTNLKCLGLQRNSLEVITAEDFKWLPNLETLDISSNPLYSWDGRVFFRRKLERFYASSNHFSYLSEAMLQDFSSFTTFDIDYSPFSCDCRMMRRMYPNKFLMTEIRDSPRYRNLLCAGSHDVTIIDFLDNTDYLDCEPKKSNMMYFFGAFLGLAFLAAITILIYIVRDRVNYFTAFVRSSEGRQSIL